MTGPEITLPTRRQLHAQLERLDISADAKVAIAEVIDLTSVAADRVIEIGRRIVAFAFELLRQFPHIGVLTILAVILNALIASVPLLGALLSSLLGPLLLVGGIAVGTLLDLRDGSLRDGVDLLTRQFQAIFT